MDKKSWLAALAVGLLSSGTALGHSDPAKAAGISGAEKMGCSGKDSCGGKDGCGTKKGEKKKDKS